MSFWNFFKNPKLKADELAKQTGFDRVAIMALAKINRDADGRKACIDKDYEYAISTLHRVNIQRCRYTDGYAMYVACREILSQLKDNK